MRIQRRLCMHSPGPSSRTLNIHYPTLMSNRKLQQTTTQITTLTNGLQRMAQTREDVANMQTQLASKTEKLEAAASEAKALLHQISVSTSQAEKDRQKVAAIVETVTAKVGGRGGWSSAGPQPCVGCAKEYQHIRLTKGTPAD